MADSYDVLVVCEGNLCRSPLAERLLRLRLADCPHIHVTSAGTNAAVGRPMDASAAAELQRLGGDPEGFAARQLTAELIAGADLVLTATRAQRSAVVGISPAALKRTFALLELAELVGDPPWAGSAEAVADGDDVRAFVKRAADWRSTLVTLGDALDIPDPIGRSMQVHHETAELVERAVTNIAELLREVQA